MAQLNMTAFANLLKDVYAKKIDTALNDSFPLLKRIEPYPDKPTGGKKWVFPIKEKRTNAFHHISDGGTFPTYTVPEWTLAEVYVKYVAGCLELSGPVQAASEGDVQAFGRSMEEAKDDLMDQMQNRMCKYLMGSGDGIQAAIASVSSPGGTVPANGRYTLSAAAAGAGFNTHLLEVGDMIVVMNGSSPRGTATITNVSHTSGYIDVDTNVTGVTGGDTLVYGTTATEHDYGKAFAGLGIYGGLLDAAATTVEGVTIASHPKWVPNYIDAGSTDLTMDLLDRAMVEVATRCGKSPNVCMANSGMITECRNMFQDQARYTGTSFKGGMASITHEVMGSELTFFFDRFFLPGQLFLLNEKQLNWFILKEGAFDTVGGLLKYTGKDSALSVWKKYLNFGSTARQCHGVVANVNQSFNIHPVL